MRVFRLLLVLWILLLLESVSFAEIRVETGHKRAGLNFTFEAVPAPADNDAVSSARISLVDGELSPNSGGLKKLQDGCVPSGDDQPSENLFFGDGTQGGRIQIDLGEVIPVQQIVTYSWHTGSRAPQVYKVYMADGTEKGFNPGPGKGTEPATCGWTFIVSVDTRPSQEDLSGQYGVSIHDSSGAIGSFRYLLFDTTVTEKDDPFGNTFYSEIDVIEAGGPLPHAIAATRFEPVLISSEAEGGKFQFTIDATDAPDLKDWSQKDLMPLVQQWYPCLVRMLPSEGYQAPTDIIFRFRTDAGDIPAYAIDSVVHLNAQWFLGELDREALGAVVHEMVHLVQNYGLANDTNSNPTPTPGWLVEGIADYIRWFLYEPQTKGAAIPKDRVSAVNYDSSYRVSGNFLNWVMENYDKEIVRKLNAAAREGRYTGRVWKEWTGKTVEELGREWKEWLER